MFRNLEMNTNIIFFSTPNKKRDGAFVLIFNFTLVSHDCIKSYEQIYFFRVKNFSICFSNWTIEFTMRVLTCTDWFFFFYFHPSCLYLSCVRKSSAIKRDPNFDQWINGQRTLADTAMNGFNYNLYCFIIFRDFLCKKSNDKSKIE